MHTRSMMITHPTRGVFTRGDAQGESRRWGRHPFLSLTPEKEERMLRWLETAPRDWLVGWLDSGRSRSLSSGRMQRPSKRTGSCALVFACSRTRLLLTGQADNRHRNSRDGDDQSDSNTTACRWVSSLVWHDTSSE